jgi:hypothetical protein
MAKINYSFQKRQRDLAKKQKQEEKKALKKEGAGREELSANDYFLDPGAPEAPADAKQEPPAPK